MDDVEVVEVVEGSHDLFDVVGCFFFGESAIWLFWF